MNLIKDIITKKLEKKNFYELRRFYIRALWEHLQIYTFALIILGMELSKKEKRRRNNFYSSLVIKGTINESDVRKMNKIFNNDFDLINRAVNKLEKLNEESSVFYGSFYQPGRVAVDMDEFPLD